MSRQAVAVEDPTSDQLGLEKFHQYTGKNTGAGATVMDNLYAGNAVWSYNPINMHSPRSGSAVPACHIVPVRPSLHTWRDTPAILAKGFQQRAERGPRIAIPPHWSERVAQWSTDDIAELRDTGVTVVGDVASLWSDPDRGEARRPTPQEVSAARMAAILAAAESYR
jgi:hypothetical protein